MRASSRGSWNIAQSDRGRRWDDGHRGGHHQQSAMMNTTEGGQLPATTTPPPPRQVCVELGILIQ